MKNCKKIVVLFLLTVLMLQGNSFAQVDELKKKYRTAVKEGDRINYFANLVVEYCNVNLDSAMILADSLITMSENTGDDEFRSRSFSVLGYVYERSGNYKLALKNELIALKLAKKTDNLLLQANSYNGVGVMYDYLGDYEKALENYFNGYEIRKKEKDLVGMQQSLSNIGLVYHLKGDFKNALDYLYKSRDLAEEIKDTPGYTSALINIALVFQQQENYKQALQLYNEALKIYLKNDSEYDIALAYNNIGSVYYDLKKWKKAISYHQKSLNIKNKIGDLHGSVMSHQNLGLIYKELNQLDSSLFHLESGRKILDSLPNPTSEIELFNSLGSCYIAKGDYTNAAKFLEKAMDIYESGIDYYKIYETFGDLATLNAELGNYKEAFQYHKRYWGMRDSIQNNENSKIVQQKEFEADYKAKKREDELKRKLEKEAEDKQQKVWNIFYLCLFTSLLIVIAFIYRNYRQKKKANNLLSERNSIISSQNVEIRKQSELLEEKNRDITDSIQYAKRLQDAILPTVSEMNSVVKDYFVLYRPKDIVSGDFYWMHDLSVNGKRKYLFAVVDCTGHGVPGGFVSIVGNNALNRAVNEFELTKPNLILDKVSELVEKSFESENTEIRDGMDIALISVSYEGEKIILEFSGANNPLWYVKNTNSGNPEIVEIKADKQPIGKYEARIPFTLHRMEMSPKDKIYLFTDGYADQFGGENGKKFKYAQLKEKLVSLGNNAMENQRKELERIILDWKGDLEQIDDICISGINL